MRRPEYHGTEAVGLQLFSESRELHLAGVDADGAPVFRALDGVVDEGWVCFHGSPAGEKTSLLGRPVVLSVEEPVARLPSTFFDPERACPATTLYRSAQVHGVLTAIEDPVRKARVLQRLMEKLQPEGGYVPLDAEHPHYRAAVRGLLVAGVPLQGLTTKVKLAQNRTPAQRERLLEQLWRRGLPGDARAVELIREANPDTPTPAFLGAPEGLRLHAWVPAARADEAAGLLVDTYWNTPFSRDTLARAHPTSSAWVAVTDRAGALVGTARALSDGAKRAWVYDVSVRPDRQRGGVGQALMRLLLDHPAVRGAQVVQLATRDAMRLYERFGFVDVRSVPPRPFTTVEMVLRRAVRP